MINPRSPCWPCLRFRPYHRPMHAADLPHEVTLHSGEERPALGLGTWRLGENAARRKQEVAALRLAFEIGYRVVDTAEMYGEGGAESVLGEALRGAIATGLSRESLFIV